MPVMEKYLTVEEVAKELRVSVDTVRRLIKDRELTAHKVRGIYRIAADEYQRYLDTTRTDKPEEK